MSLRTARWVFIPPIVVACILCGFAYGFVYDERYEAAIICVGVAQLLTLVTFFAFILWRAGR